MTKKMILSLTAAIIMASSVGLTNVFAAGQLGNPAPSVVHEDGDHEDDDEHDEEDGDHSYTINITNSTGHDIKSLFISPADQEDWDDDLLEDGDDLADDETVSVTYEESADEYEATSWDLKAEIEGDDLEFADLTLDAADENNVTLNEDGTATVE